MISTIRLQEQQWPLWDRFTETAQGGTLQHQTWWLRLAGASCHRLPAIWGVFKGDALIGGCALLENELSSSAGGGPCCQYQGLAFAGSRSSKAYRSEQNALRTGDALAGALSKAYQSVTFTNHPEIRDVRPFLWAGWKAEICYDYLWDILEGSTLQTLMHHDVRRQLKAAQDAKIVVHIGNEWETVFHLWRLSFDHKGLHLLLDPRTIGRWYEALAEKEMASTYLAFLHGSAVAGLTIVKWKRSLYLWFNGIDPAYRKSGAHTLLMWQVMMDHVESHKVFDLCGGDVPGVAAYKASLGARLVPHYRLRMDQP